MSLHCIEHPWVLNLFPDEHRRVIRCHSSLRQNEFVFTLTVIGRGCEGVASYFAISDACATLNFSSHLCKLLSEKTLSQTIRPLPRRHTRFQTLPDDTERISSERSSSFVKLHAGQPLRLAQQWQLNWRSTGVQACTVNIGKTVTPYGKRWQVLLTEVLRKLEGGYFLTSSRITFFKHLPSLSHLICDSSEAYIVSKLTSANARFYVQCTIGVCSIYIQHAIGVCSISTKHMSDVQSTYMWYIGKYSINNQ